VDVMFCEANVNTNYAFDIYIFNLNRIISLLVVIKHNFINLLY